MEVEGTDLGLLKDREKNESPNKLLIIIVVVLIILVFGLCFGLIALGLTFGKSESTSESTLEPTTIHLTPKIVIFDNQTLLHRMEMKGDGKQWKLINGVWGFYMEPKEVGEISIIFNNTLSVDSIIHLHGQSPSYLFDGVPYLSAPPISPGRIASITFQPKTIGYPNDMGTYFMHSHFGFQTNLGMAAPFIIDQEIPADHPYSEQANQAQDVLFFLQEACPLLGGHPEMDCDHDKIYEHIKNVNGNKTGETIKTSYKYVLANGKLSGEEPYRLTITKKESTIRYGTTLRLRVINAASTSNFLVSFGSFNGTCIAVDGQLVKPLTQTSFWVGVAQRMDIILTYETEGSYPIQATTGEIDTSSKSTGIWVDIAASKLNTAFPVVKAGLMLFKTEVRLNAFRPLIAAPPNKVFRINITGSDGFNSINGVSYQLYPWKERPIYPNPNPLLVNYGDRVHIEILGFDGKEHAIHLHGHHFQVIQIGEETFSGAVRDTVNVAPDQLVVIAFDALHPGVWLLNCQSEWDLAAGMITTVEYY
eukprot:TRINITY_DN6793_c0_g1_i1.p1 TRINITY_DN6793_c0_g1~~TRINITY_DN6793_c0_g1_i1.p1  ORF type:complete len:533 (-),score=126.92 TRINITY_DN6793_c0_g1_i1:109-1707(-)